MKEDKIYWAFSMHGKERETYRRFHKEISGSHFKVLKINVRI
jgi:hypothetical protein